MSQSDFQEKDYKHLMIIQNQQNIQHHIQSRKLKSNILMNISLGNTIDGHDIEKFKPFGHLFGKVHKKHFKIDDDDEIFEISGYAGTRINELKFKIYKGKEESFGIKNGVHFIYSFPGHTFGVVSGGYEKHLDFIKFLVNELPPTKHHLKIIIVKM